MAFRDIFSIDVTMEIEFLDFDMDKFHKGLFDYGNRLIRRAGRAFCQEIFNNVPVWSGMALASLRPLARAVRFALPITPAEGAPNRISLGESLGGQTPLQSLSVEGTADMTFSFNWRTLVEHFNINNQVNVNRIINPKTGSSYFRLKKPGPWKAIEKAQSAALKVLSEGVVKAPKPTDFMTKKKIVFDPKLGQFKTGNLFKIRG